MIYLDNGATTFPKPISVINAINNANKMYGANPGRGGHKLSIKASELVFDARSKVAKFFGLNNPENVIFTLNCTVALNLVIKGVLKPGDNVLISNYEHNAVVRPLEKLKNLGVTYTIVDVSVGDNDKTVDNFRNAITDKTKLVVCNYASNVFGVKLPVERISALCHQYGILCCVDGAQSAGLVPVNLSESSIDYLCLAGHKGLYGPMGIGALLINCEKIPDTLIEGGTGSSSLNYFQPENLPDKFESGTNNFSGIVGLGAGISFLNNKNLDAVYSKEMSLIQYLYKSFKKLNKVILYTDYPNKDYYVPLLSFNVKGFSSEEVSQYLDSKYNIATRSGLHCAPLAHKTHNTTDIGTVRIVPSIFTQKYEIDFLIRAITNI